MKLKDFYDPKDRLSLEEAVEDMGLIRKFRELYLFFYGMKDRNRLQVQGSTFRVKDKEGIKDPKFS